VEESLTLKIVVEEMDELLEKYKNKLLNL